LIRQLSFTELDRQNILDKALDLIESRADANLDLNNAMSEIEKILLLLPSCDDEPEESAFGSNGNREEALQRCKCQTHCTPNNVNKLDAKLKEGQVCEVGTEKQKFRVYYHSRSIVEKMDPCGRFYFCGATSQGFCCSFSGILCQHSKAQDSAAPSSYGTTRRPLKARTTGTFSK
jgi:hypothetical protein